jgi:hypothetical protein
VDNIQAAIREAYEDAMRDLKKELKKLKKLPRKELYALVLTLRTHVDILTLRNRILADAIRARMEEAK